LLIAIDYVGFGDGTAEYYAGNMRVFLTHTIRIMRVSTNSLLFKWQNNVHQANLFQRLNRLLASPAITLKLSFTTYEIIKSRLMQQFFFQEFAKMIKYQLSYLIWFGNGIW